MSFVTNFAKFWYDFIIGDDWLIAALVAITLVVLKVALNHNSPWWLLPIVVILGLGASLLRATR